MKTFSKARLLLVSMLVLVLAVVWTSTSLGRTEVQARTEPSTASARTLVVRYLSALQSRRFAVACSLLGDDMVMDAVSSGLSCPSSLALRVPQHVRWSIIDTRALSDGVGVRFLLEHDGVYYVRMRELVHATAHPWLAIVRTERGADQIVAIRLAD
jgi:hypothetical protein